MKSGEINYPVKYAIQPHFSETSKQHNIDSYPIGYTISKVYVIEERKKVQEDGQVEETYLVVYPYIDTLAISDNKRSVPKTNIDGVCYNGTIVSDVFDSYDAALSMRDEYYRSLFLYDMKYIQPSDQERFKLEFFDRTQIYELYELQGLEQTKDMVVKTKNKAKVLEIQ
jgi:hypothetical protein